MLFLFLDIFLSTWKEGIFIFVSIQRTRVFIEHHFFFIKSIFEQVIIFVHKGYLKKKINYGPVSGLDIRFNFSNQKLPNNVYVIL